MKHKYKIIEKHKIQNVKVQNVKTKIQNYRKDVKV